MEESDINGTLAFHLTPPTGPSFHLSSKISQQLSTSTRVNWCICIAATGEQIASYTLPFKHTHAVSTGGLLADPLQALQHADRLINKPHPVLGLRKNVNS